MPPSALLNNARAALGDRRYGQARAYCEAILRQESGSAEVLDILGQCAFALGDLEGAADAFAKVASLYPREPRGHLALAEVRRYQGRYNDAISRYNRVLRLQPEHRAAIAGKADAFEKRGDRDKARELLQPWIASGRDDPSIAVVQARLDLHDRKHEAVIGLIEGHLRRGDAAGHPLQHLYFLLGKALERERRHDEAFEAYRKAHEVVEVKYDADRMTRHVDEIITAFSAWRLRTLPRAADRSELPVLVIGMPRSGSTLVESIIGAHPDAHPGGELPYVQEIANGLSLRIGSTLTYPACVEDLAREDVDGLSAEYLGRLRLLNRRARRIVDKYLMTFRHLGLIELFLPGARVIHCRRHPLDIAISCYGEPLPAAAHPYAGDLAAFGRAYLDYERLMRHWREVLEIPILDVQYEELVAGQEKVSRAVIDFCSLPWDDRCLRYYETNRDVRTSSYDQVNRPVYTSSVGRHERFEKHLRPLRAVLGDAQIKL